MSCKLDKSLQFYRKAIQCLLAVKRNKVANGGKITLDEKIEYQSKAWQILQFPIFLILHLALAAEKKQGPHILDGRSGCPWQLIRPVLQSRLPLAVFQKKHLILESVLTNWRCILSSMQKVKFCLCKEGVDQSLCVKLGTLLSKRHSISRNAAAHQWLDQISMKIPYVVFEKISLA